MAQTQTSNNSNTSRRSNGNATTSSKSRSTNTNSKSIVKIYPNNAVGRAEMLVDEAEAAGITPRQLEIMMKLAKMVQGL